MFTLADKGLLDRAARLLLEQAAAIEFSYGKPAWVGEEARKEKLVFDRLQRDARDLRSLAKRLANHFQVAPAPRQPKVGPTAAEALAKVADAVAQQMPLDVVVVDPPLGGVVIDPLLDEPSIEMKVFSQETASAEQVAEPSIEEQRAMGVLGGHGADLQGMGIGHG